MASILTGSALGFLAAKQLAPLAFNLAKDASAFTKQFMIPAAVSMTNSLAAVDAYKQENPEADKFARNSNGYKIAVENAMRPVDFTGVAPVSFGK